MKDEKDNFGNLNVWIFIAIILCGFALYFLPLQSATFCFDDHYSIESNEAIKTIDIPRIFDAFNTRFLPGLSFALNYKWCGLHPAGYRLINVLIHCLNAFLVYLLIKSTLYLYPARKPILSGRLEWPAVFASMLFLCHPIQTEPVNFITQRFVLMGTFFYLLTLLLYIQYRCRSQKRYMIAGMGSAIAAMFCKEFVVTLPVMLALYDFYFLGSFNETMWKHCRRLIPFFVIVLIVPILLSRTPREAIGVANIADVGSIQEGDSQRFISHIDVTRAHGNIGRKQYFLTELNVVCTYVRLLFLPINQNFDYDYPISYQLDNKTVLCGVFLFCLLAFAVVTYKSCRIVSFSILWFFIALSVESSFIPIGHVIAEYRLYLASVGFVFLVMTLIYSRQVDQRKLNIIAAVILIGFSILTYQRNKVWKNEITLWDDTVKKSPHKPRPYNNRGNAYFDQGDVTQAMSDYNKAIEIDTSFVDAYNNRGFIYDKQGNLTQAMSNFNEAIEIDPSFASAYYNRGTIYDQQGNFTQAVSDYSKAIGIKPNFAEAYNNRGDVYNKQGNFTQAMSDFNRAIEINPKYVEAYNNRGLTYDQQGNLTQAMFDFTKAIELNPSFANAYNNRGNVYDKQGNLVQAMSDYSKAIELNPNYAEAYNNRGTIYDQQGNFTQAMSDYNKAIELNLNYAEVFYNRSISYYHLKEYDKAWADVHKIKELGETVDPQFINALSQASGQDK
jgi:tetratricopeptide (TPR) repeat protein